VGTRDPRVSRLGRPAVARASASRGSRAPDRAYPKDFLYGSVAADISLAKKYVPEGRHCHHWHIGEEIFETAETERLRAVGLGYLSHLAADTIAHNFFVPAAAPADVLQSCPRALLLGAPDGRAARESATRGSRARS
jgi:hypothetical protein